MRLLAKYMNGNYGVKLYSNGTKIRFTKAEKFESAFPENIDIKITDYCDAGCPFCHENSTTRGSHGDLSPEFLKTLKPGTELAIGGGNPLSHPKLPHFLTALLHQGVIANVTVNEKNVDSFIINVLDKYMKDGYIKGLGISVNSYNPAILEFAQTHSNVVLHVINGIMPYEDLIKMADKNVKILILGYKQFRRGETYMNPTVTSKMNTLKSGLCTIMESFHTVSFDNLGIEQLEPQRFMSEDEWNQFYMGDDGNFTMYIDLVKKEFARNSTSHKRYTLLDNIDSMFQIIKEESHELSRDVH